MALSPQGDTQVGYTMRPKLAQKLAPPSMEVRHGGPPRPRLRRPSRQNVERLMKRIRRASPAPDTSLVGSQSSEVHALPPFAGCPAPTISRPVHQLWLGPPPCPRGAPRCAHPPLAQNGAAKSYAWQRTLWPLLDDPASSRSAKRYAEGGSNHRLADPPTLLKKLTCLSMAPSWNSVSAAMMSVIGVSVLNFCLASVPFHCWLEHGGKTNETVADAAGGTAIVVEYLGFAPEQFCDEVQHNAPIPFEFVEMVRRVLRAAYDAPPTARRLLCAAYYALRTTHYSLRTR